MNFPSAELIKNIIEINPCVSGETGDAGGPDHGTSGATQPASELEPHVLNNPEVDDGPGHGNKEVFSCLGIQLAVNFFLERGHADVIVFVPLWRKEPSRPDVPISAERAGREVLMRRWR
ncbi:hypothetical protein CRUP_019936 [Coryphaenoides rupestris]|nr:hypothetical protein CRUP_019936 [Coryphaenoides rupestris]